MLAKVLSALALAATFLPAQGGPDYFRVAGVSQDDTLNVRSGPGADSEKIGEIAPTADCLRNLGCQGGLTLQEFTTLSETEKEQRLKENPRWCQVEYQGLTGWVAGRYLVESGCGGSSTPSPTTAPVAPLADMESAKSLLAPEETLRAVDLPVVGTTVVTGSIEGYKTVVYAIALVERQRLTVRMDTQSSAAYFNVIDTAVQDGSAVFRGEVAEQPEAQIDAKNPTTYLIRPFLVRSAARRGEAAEYRITITRE